MDASLQARAEQLAKEIASEARTAEDLNGLMRLMMKSALERMLDTEMDVHLGRKTTSSADAAPAASEEPSDQTKTGKKNRRNGRGRKTVRSDTGDLTISTPRDRNGT
jgi:putative transposase